MSVGYVYGEPEPTDACPYCGEVCHADFCDVGVGMVQAGPYHCRACGASEIGPNDAERDLTQAERACGWYGPASEPGSSANVIGGKIVSHKEMKDAYSSAFTGNPRYFVEGAVERWQEDIRKNGGTLA